MAGARAPPTGAAEMVEAAERKKRKALRYCIVVDLVKDSVEEIDRKTVLAEGAPG
mgnify:CR=1 FL=1